MENKEALEKELTDLKARAFDVRNQVETLDRAYGEILKLINNTQAKLVDLSKEEAKKKEDDVQETTKESN